MIAFKKEGHRIPCISTINKTMISFQQTNFREERKKKTNKDKQG